MGEVVQVKDWSGNSKTSFVTIGASNHCEGERENNDYYATEPRALELLLDVEDFDPYVWECACGQGHLSQVLKNRGYIVKSTDLVDRGYGEGGIDFLLTEDTFNGDIITNPPYKYAQQFVEHALDIIPEGNRVAMFLKLTFLESKGRRALFDISPPPAHLCSIKPITLCEKRRFRHTKASGKCCRIRLVYLEKRFHRRTKSEVV